MNVLFVSAHPRVLQMVRAALSEDATIAEARTPERALALFDEGARYDVVVADGDTAPTGGFALCRELRAREAMGAAVPGLIVLVARPQDAWLANWAQADAWALKPADPFDLAQLVAAVAAGRPIPDLPGVGGRPSPVLGEIPGPEHADEATAAAAASASTGGQAGAAQNA